ncbi:MAG: hypothetical protein ABRQ24_07125 [Syntrophomonadaceae bacterium]
MNTLCMDYFVEEDDKQRIIRKVLDKINALSSDARVYFTISLDSDYEELCKELEREGCIMSANRRCMLSRN